MRGAVSSWKQMPLYLYQIQTKERDEPRPRGGLILARANEAILFQGIPDSDLATVRRVLNTMVSKQLGTPEPAAVQ